MALASQPFTYFCSFPFPKPLQCLQDRTSIAASLCLHYLNLRDFHLCFPSLLSMSSLACHHFKLFPFWNGNLKCSSLWPPFPSSLFLSLRLPLWLSIGLSLKLSGPLTSLPFHSSSVSPLLLSLPAWNILLFLLLSSNPLSYFLMSWPSGKSSTLDKFGFFFVSSLSRRMHVTKKK